VNSLEDAAARVKALREEAEELTRRKTERGLVKHERARLEAIKDESVGLKARIEELRADAKRRRELDAIAEGVDEVEGYSTKGRLGARNEGWDEKQMKALHSAIIERRPLAVQAKTVSTAEGPQALVPSYRFTDFALLRDRMRVLDTIPTEPTTATTVNYFRATTAAAAAATVAEGGLKPESTPAWEQVSTPVRKIAHWARANDEVLQDFSSAMDFIGREMLAGLVDVESSQLLSGDGIAPNLLGLLNVTGVQTQARGTDSNADCVFKAIQLVRTSVFQEPDTIVLHPTNFGTIRLSKDGQGQYLAGGLGEADSHRLWGFNVIITTRIPSGTGLVANMKLGAHVYQRQAPTLEVNPFGGNTDAWLRNQTLVRAEERLALTSPRPTALVKCTGLN
jgi:HK97 family phage major capsid protein